MSERPPSTTESDGGRANEQPTKGRKPILWGDLLFSLGVLGLGTYFAFGAFNIRLLSGYSRIGPRFFPFLVAGGMLLCGVLLLIQALRGQEAPLEAGEDVDVEATSDWRAVAILTASLIAGIMLMERLGFVLASTVLFWGVAFGFGSRRYLRDSLSGLVLATAVYLAFTRLLDLNLPAGVLPFMSLILRG